MVIADTSDRRIGERVVIEKIPLHLEKKGELPYTPDTLPETITPPQSSLFSWYQNSLMIYRLRPISSGWLFTKQAR